MATRISWEVKGSAQWLSHFLWIEVCHEGALREWPGRSWEVKSCSWRAAKSSRNCGMVMGLSGAVEGVVASEATNAGSFQVAMVC